MNRILAFLVSGILCSFLSAAWADGINSSGTSDLPIGAGGSSFMYLGGGQQISQGTVNFGSNRTSPMASINTTTGAANFNGNITTTGTVGIGGATATATTVTTANALASLLSACGVGAPLVVGAGGTLTCGMSAEACTTASQTQSIACPTNYTGSHTQQRDYTCSGNTGTWGSWYDTSNTCAAPCTPTSSTRAASCPSGYTGSITQENDYTCSGGTGSWSGWYNASSTCAVAAPVAVGGGNCTLYGSAPCSQFGCGPGSGTITIGGGSCTLYTSAACAPYGCGPGPGCPSTWSYTGTGRSGGCSSGTFNYTPGATSFTCTTSGASYCPTTWSYWGAGQSGGCSRGTSSYTPGGTSFTCYQ